MSKRSALFVAEQNREAKQEGRRRHSTIEFWYRRKYGLTSNDPRFLDATVEEMLADYYAHTYYDDPKAVEAVEDDDFDPDEVEAIIAANRQPPNDWEDLS